VSTLWIARGLIDLRRRLDKGPPDVVLATGPPMVALLVARLGVMGSSLPLVIEFRDLWAANPAYDPGGRTLAHVEAWILRRASAVVVCTPEAGEDLRARHPWVADRAHVLPNGFEPELLRSRRPARPAAGETLQLLHSGTLTLHRPLSPLLRVLQREPYRSRLRLVLHGYVVPELVREAAEAAASCQIELVAASSWADAVERIAAADIALITQAASAGDATAVASKVYEYLALGKPVLCLTDGGATEALLRRLGADAWCARLGDEASIMRALDSLLAGEPWAQVPVERLVAYDRSRIAAGLVAVLDRILHEMDPAAPRAELTVGVS
jgi:glycosyltransferase involved in cell wall biosynthesis